MIRARAPHGMQGGRPHGPAPARPAARAPALAAATVLAAAAGAVALLTLTGPAASAATQARDGWIQLAHLSPNTPAVDVYLYSFGDSSAQIVLDHVSYGTVSPFEQVKAGDYTVAMRLAGASASSKPVLSTVVDIAAGHAYTVAGMGPAAGLRLQVISDRLTTPRGKALVRVIQASMQQDSVTVTAGGTRLATGLRFASVTSYVTVRPGTWTVRAAGSSETATATISLAAGSIHTLVVLDEPGTLAIDDLLEAAGSPVAPIGAVQTGLGGTAARPGASLRPWLAVATAGLLSAAGGIGLLSRRRRPALHARQPARPA
jgi:Domain of unknown function (DUF4397)